MKSVYVPALEHDALMLRKYGEAVSPNGRLERRIVANLIAHLGEKGFVPVVVWDGDEEVEVAGAKSAMEVIFNLEAPRFEKYLCTATRATVLNCASTSRSHFPVYGANGPNSACTGSGLGIVCSRGDVPVT